MLSGDMADIFSNLYLSISVNYYENNYNVSKKLTNYIIDQLLNEKYQVQLNQKTIDRVKNYFK